MPHTNAIKAARRYWNEKAQGYAERRTEKDWAKEIDEIVSSILNVGSSSLVLDVGVGPGLFATQLVNKKHSKVVGLDLSKQLLNIAKNEIKKAGVSNDVFLVAGSADFLPFRDSYFDAATSMMTIHHLPPPRIQESFNEIRRVLRKGGRFVLAESWAYKPRNEFQTIAMELRMLQMRTETEEYHLKYYEYITMLENAGLKMVDLQFHPYKIPLSRFKHLKEKRASELLKRAKQFEEKKRIVEITIISLMKIGNDA